MKAAILDTAFKGPLLPTVHLQCTDNSPDGRGLVSDDDTDVSKTHVANMIQQALLGEVKQTNQ